MVGKDRGVDNKGPACQPLLGSPGQYVGDTAGDCLITSFFSQAQLIMAGDPPPDNMNSWEFVVYEIGGQDEYQITLHVRPPVEVEKNKKLWLAISTQLPLFQRYSTVWFASDTYNGNPSQFWNSIGTGMWEPLDGTAFPNDQAFIVSGDKVGCIEGQLYGDVEPPLCPSSAATCDPVQPGDCDADVDDILLVLDDFSGLITPPQAGDIEPCSPDGAHGDGDTDVDDILGVLDAFSGTQGPDCVPPCPGCP
jgi:hypothetical protein